MYRALVIGCGNIGALYDFDNEQIITHARAIHTDPRFSLSVFDINKELAQKICNKYNCEIIEEINEQIMQSFNCVSICTPTHTHHEFLEKALDAKVKIIICEKPVCNEKLELQDIQGKYIKGNSKIIVNYIRRFQPAFYELKNLISELVRNESLTNINVRYQKGFINNCSHAFDTIEYLTNSEMILESVKIHDPLSDHLENDPTLSLQAVWNDTNVSIAGLTNVQFSHFEIDFYFDYHKICIKNAGQNIEVYKAEESKQFLQPLKLKNQFTRENCLQDYMKYVFDYAHQLLNGEKKEDNFLNSVNLVLRMKNYMHN